MSGFQEYHRESQGTTEYHGVPMKYDPAGPYSQPAALRTESWQLIMYSLRTALKGQAFIVRYAVSIRGAGRGARWHGTVSDTRPCPPGGP